jgi:hypothetical protein
MNGVVQVFEADSGEFVIAFLGTMGSDGLLIWRGAKGWEFHAPNSRAWDAQHQGTYRNSRSTPIGEAALKARGIPLPDPAAYSNTALQWKDNFASAVASSAVHDVALEMLANGTVHLAHLILYEDRYETAFGDGKFLYPHAAFWDAEQCNACLQRLGDEEDLKIAAGFYSVGREFTAKELLIRLDRAEQKVVADLRIGAYEHYDLNEILLLLDPRMAWQAETSSAVWRAAVFPPVLARLDSRPHDPVEEQVWVVARGYTVTTPLGAIRQPIVEAAFWSEAQAQELAQQTPPDRHAYPVRICAHQSGERLVAYQHQEGLALHNVVALLAMDSTMK